MRALNYIVVLALAATHFVAACNPAVAREPSGELKSFLETHCVDCHDGPDAERGLDLRWNSPESSESWVGKWEKIWNRVSARQMPPPEYPRPEEEEYETFLHDLGSVLDHHASQLTESEPKTDANRLRRLTRTEYHNVIDDLFGFPVQLNEILVKDESSRGFDNLTTDTLSPAAIERYLSAAQIVASLAAPGKADSSRGRTVRIPADLTQDQRLPGMPFGSRGGVKFNHHFAKPGVYEFAFRLTRDRDEKVEGLYGTHHLDLLVDGVRQHRFEIKPPPRGDDTLLDAALHIELEISEGMHEIIATFEANHHSVPTIRRQPFDASFNRHRHPRKRPALFEVTLFGPRTNPSHPLNRVSVSSVDEDVAKHGEELSALMRRAYRRPPTEEDWLAIKRILQSNDDAGASRQDAIAAVLSSPYFLFRIEPHAGPLDPWQLASRLSFALWSSVPDEQLLSDASEARLSSPEDLRRSIARMLEDPKSSRLVDNFFEQWLKLKNLSAVKPNLRDFPDFDENLRRSMREETRHCLQHWIETDTPLAQWIDSDWTFMDERLATHYGIAGVLGPKFRKVSLENSPRRGGLLQHAGVLALTSYATRTSPTIRGNFVLEKILGTPAPPPPQQVDPLPPRDSSAGKPTTVRERLRRHREDEACASCHQLMDPIGLALENFDAVGRFRWLERDAEISILELMPDDTVVRDHRELIKNLASRPDRMATAMVEGLFTFTLGRPVEEHERRHIRHVVDNASESDFRFSSIVIETLASPLVTGQPDRQHHSIHSAESNQ